MNTTTASDRIISVGKPEKTNSTFGNWRVYYTVESSFGTRFSKQIAFFWKKSKAVEFCKSHS